MLLAPPSGNVSSDTQNSWLREQERAHRKAVELSIKVRDATASGRRLQPAMRNYLRNPQARLSAALRALGGVPAREPAIGLASRLGDWERARATVMWRSVPKRNGGQRIICILPPELKAAHYLLKRPLEQLFKRASNIFGVNGSGRDALAEEIKRLQSDGFVYAATTDIIDCYTSVNPSVLYELPLPKEVIRNTLDLRTVRSKWYCGSGLSQRTSDTYHDAYNASGPTGLMQGSPLSGLILAWLLNGIPTSDEARVFLCFDNLVVLAKSPDRVRAMMDTLVAHFERCSAGPLVLYEPEYFNNEPFDFLGYRFDPESTKIGISERGHIKIMSQLVEAEAVQEKLFHHIYNSFQFRMAGISLAASINPLLGRAPVHVWRALLNIRTGYAKVPGSSPELTIYRDESRYLAEWSGSSAVIHLHDSLFAEAGTVEYEAIRSVLRRSTELETEAQS